MKRFIFKTTNTVEEMNEWLNETINTYPFVERPFLGNDLCRCIILVDDNANG